MPRPPSRNAPTARLADTGLAPLDDSVHIWPGEEVKVGGNRLNVRVTPGDGTEPAVFVHGLGGSAHNWTDFAGVLRNRLAIHSIDLPGHGRSGPAPRNRYTPDLHADAVIGYIEQRIGEPVHLAGNSMGGAISILIAAKRPDLVRTLTLVSPAVPDNRIRIYPLKNDPRLMLLMLPVVGEWAVKRFNVKFAPEVRVAGTIALCFADKTRYPRARRDEAVAETRARLDMPWAEAAVLRSMRGLALSQILRGRSGWATMRRITAPTLVVWGDKDKLVAPDLAAYVAAAIPNASLLVFSDIGHTAMMEDPVRTARAMVGLLEDTVVAPG
jgi:pimeloyl-ACP methyl ester carboxylesterase